MSGAAISPATSKSRSRTGLAAVEIRLLTGGILPLSSWGGRRLLYGRLRAEPSTLGVKMVARKTKKLWVRLTWEQWIKLRRAARQETERRGEDVAPGTLLREVGFPAVEILLQQPGQVLAEQALAVGQ